MRKMKKYEQSLDYHRQAMVLSPQNSTTYVAIGFVYSLMFKWHEAVENFHKALGLKRDDTFTSHMINLAMDHLISCLTPLSGSLVGLFFSNLTDILFLRTDPLPPYDSNEQQRGNKSQPVALLDVDMDISGE